MELERLARVEEKIDHIVDLLNRWHSDQAKKNIIFFRTRDDVNILKATARGAWKTLAILGTVSAALGATFAWLVEHRPSLSDPPSAISKPER